MDHLHPVSEKTSCFSDLNVIFQCFEGHIHITLIVFFSKWSNRGWYQFNGWTLGSSVWLVHPLRPYTSFPTMLSQTNALHKKQDTSKKMTKKRGHWFIFACCCICSRFLNGSLEFRVIVGVKLKYLGFSQPKNTSDWCRWSNLEHLSLSNSPTSQGVISGSYTDECALVFVWEETKGRNQEHNSVKAAGKHLLI